MASNNSSEQDTSWDFYGMDIVKGNWARNIDSDDPRLRYSERGKSTSTQPEAQGQKAQDSSATKSSSYNYGHDKPMFLWDSDYGNGFNKWVFTLSCFLLSHIANRECIHSTSNTLSVPTTMLVHQIILIQTFPFLILVCILISACLLHSIHGFLSERHHLGSETGSPSLAVYGQVHGDQAPFLYVPSTCLLPFSQPLMIVLSSLEVKTTNW